MIDGVIITPLKTIADERGSVKHMLRKDAPQFTDFGEVYFSLVHPGAVKAWKLHKRMVMNLAVPVGLVKLVLFDDRKNSSTAGSIQEIIFGADDYKLVTIPPLIWNGFQGLGEVTSVITNCASITHDPDEGERRDINDPSIPYSWTGQAK